jgi:hypothetical protein
MNLRTIATAALLISPVLLADDVDDRSKLMGKWELQKAHSDKAPVWVVEDIVKNKDEFIHITRTVGGQTVSDFECNVGVECAVKDAGKSAKVIMYFNGSRLVETETKGSEVVKRRFTLAPKDDTLEVEVMPLVPSGDTEKLVFKRLALTTAKQ